MSEYCYSAELITSADERQDEQLRIAVYRSAECRAVEFKLDELSPVAIFEGNNNAINDFLNANYPGAV